MEDLKNLSDHTNVLQISKALQKIAKVIEEEKKDTSKKEFAIEELIFLKELCLSNNVQLSHLSSQTLYGLVESGVLEPANVMTMFITMLSNATTPKKMSVIGEGIINILLLDLKIATLRSKSINSYVCPFGMKTAQHPIITLIHKKNVDMIDMANKLIGICNHIDEYVRINSIEFLRPVFLHIFCNPLQILNAEPIWQGFLKQQRLESIEAKRLLHEIFTWCRITPEKYLSLSMQLIDVIELYLEMGNMNSALEYQIYLISLTQILIENGIDPRNAFNTILKTIQNVGQQSIDDEISDYMLITMSQIIHNISPLYLRNALEIIKVLAKRKPVGNAITRNMILDSLIVRLAINAKSLQPQVTSDIERLIKLFRKSNDHTTKIDCSKTAENESVKSAKYLHPSIVINFNLVRLSRNLCADLTNSQTITLKRIINFLHVNQQFANEIQFFLRAILLSVENLVPFEMWTDILKQLLSSPAENPNISCDTIYFMLYLIAKETEGQKQLELLRGLTTFATSKENMPLILNTYRALYSSPRAVLKIVSVDLHTRLWSAENRTYQFLHKVLINDDDKLTAAHKWEMNIAKSHAIKRICSEKASQHGTDLVAPLSKILNSSTDNDLARSLALDAVVLLCKSQTVNIISTWNVLKNAFNSKNLQPRTTKSLCDFFGEVPLLKSTSNDYDLLFREALKQLWEYIMTSDDVGIIRSALHALRNFDFNELALEHLPSVLYENIRLPREYQVQIATSHSDPNNAPLSPADVVPFIPGDCWIQLIQQINENALNDAIDFIAYLIESEMIQYRSGVYMVQEGKPEPKEFQHLHARSPLRALVKFLVNESDDKCDPSTALKCLKCVSKKYSRPIPPFNWFFLIEYINQGAKFEGCNEEDQFKMRQYALNIASNQIGNSGSAKTLVENYLTSLNANNNDPKEIQMALELIDGISPRILANFLHETLTLVYELSASSQFEENCYFEQALNAVSKVFDKKCLVQENIDILTDEICRFNDILRSDSKIYDKYATYAVKLSSESLDRLSTPTEWNNDNFKKALILRTKAVSLQKPCSNSPNPWMWLDLLFDNAFDLNDSIVNAERKDLLLKNILSLLMNQQNTNENQRNAWIMYMLGKVQSNFNQEHTEDTIAHSIFLFDTFIFILVVVTGTAMFTDDDLNLKNQPHWFPEALWLLSKKPQWDDQMPRIFEFLYHLKTQQKNLPKEYSSILSNTLICVKNNEYFLQRSTWNKFISLN